MENQSSTERILAELRRYFDLRILHLKYLGTEKLSYLLSATIFITICAILGGIVVCYFSHSLLHLLLIYVGATTAYAIVGAAALFSLAIIFWQRKKWILNPITRALSRIMIDNNNENHKP